MYPIVRVVQPDRTQLYLVISEQLVVGRECDGLLLADDKVSRQHLRLAPNPDGNVIVSDLGSTNGSFINQARIEGDVMLVAGSALTLGDTTITLEAPQPPPARHTGETTRRDVGGTIVATLPPSDNGANAVPPPAAAPPSTPAAPPPAVAPAMPAVPAGARTSNEPVVRPRGGGAEETRRTSMDELAASLGGQQLNLPSGSADDTVTIMFSDIESSTELALSMGDHRWYEILTWHNNLIEQRVAAHGGFIVKNQGDGFMVTFNSARRAIICASEIQQALHDHATNDPSSAIRVRIGLHTGEAIRQDSGDLFGRHVIIAARVGGLANGAEILVSSIVREIASARGDLHFGEGNMAELKGVGEQMVYPVLWGAELPSA